jgi:putative transposase
MIEAAERLAGSVGVAPACDALGVSRATVYRRRSGRTRAPAARPTPARALSPGERRAVLEVLHSERFADTAPAEVCAILLDEGTYHCSPRTAYRLLAAQGEARERRNQLRHPRHPVPQLVAFEPNQLWSWDITKVRTLLKWSCYFLYVLLDVFSRYVVGWLLAREESAALAEQLIAEACARQRIGPGQLTVHSDRGSPMMAKSLGQLYADLDVARSLSRPRVSNDNAFSEAQFKTLKYRPDYPGRFGSFEHALAHFRRFFPWYNFEHRHSGIAMLTPAVVHYGLADQVIARRTEVLRAAYEAYPERFVRQPPRPQALPTAVWINRPRISASGFSEPETTRLDAPGSPIVEPVGSNYVQIAADSNPLLLPRSPSSTPTTERSRHDQIRFYTNSDNQVSQTP